MSDTKQHPQRISPPAKPGALMMRLTALSRSIKAKDAGERDPAYLEVIRDCPCVGCLMDPCGTAAHVRMQSAAHGKRGGMGKKPADKWAVPLCERCHTRDPNSQHNIGEKEFCRRLGINPLLLCTRLHGVKSSLEAMRIVAFNAVAEAENRAQMGGAVTGAKRNV